MVGDDKERDSRLELFPIHRGENIPPPRKPGSTPIYPFDRLEVGEYFIVLASGNTVSAKQSAYGYGQRHGKEFRIRSHPDGSVEIWRTK